MRKRLCGTAALLALLAGPAAADPAPDLSGATKSVFLPYLNAPLSGEPITRPPALSVSFGGRVARAVMDTGSTGIVVSAKLIPNLAGLPKLGPGSLTYTSSGRIMQGDWVVTPVTIAGTNGASVTTRPLPVLAVRQVACLKTARNCRPRTDPTGIAMLGIGFARQGDRQAQSTPDRNPFLNLPDMGTAEAPGAMRRGYVVSKSGVAIGLSAAAAKNFAFLKLARSTEFPDWAALPACLSLGARTPPACGTALVDTGVTVMYLTLPDAQLQGQSAPGPDGKPTLAAGKRLDIAFGAAAAYGFALGDGTDPVAPERVILVPRPDRTFVNTGVRLLNRFDYLFDADGGYVGFRPRT
ncbi:hypothetical protein [Aquabacter spiritensis]|uniref:Aspartyl protease n=1 Tax=Aquabacter spiritensis TaxID=933073 RepID=A0A4R3M0T5_9HYPH|nr:hypothetical protein [Aquabacter spiritensis]TCT06206.1 hypothetical protein EDC64_103310 [Aquabacter spiritensis]